MGTLVSSAGIVAVPLLLLALLALGCVVERCAFWWRVVWRQEAVVQKALKLLQTDVAAAVRLLKANPDLPLVRVFLEAIALKRPTPEEFALALDNAARREQPALRRFNTVFDSVVSVSPLLGLLGTVLGLMRSFASLQLGDVSRSDVGAVTGGISEALASTVLGLVVAIVTLLWSNVFRSLYRRQIAAIREYGGRLELIYRRQLRLSQSGESKSGE